MLAYNHVKQKLYICIYKYTRAAIHKSNIYMKVYSIYISYVHTLHEDACINCYFVKQNDSI